jgi:hypothetical protein
MEQTALILIVLTLLLLVIIVGLLSVLIFKMFRQNQPPVSTNNKPASEPLHADLSRADLHPEILERMKMLEKVKPKRADLFCPNHSEEPGETVCAICDKLFCKACIKPFKTMHFCKEHLPLIMKHDWEEALTLKTSTQDPEQGVRLYDVKKELFNTKDIPTYIETHYKINVDQDYIETYLVLFGIKENLAELKAHLPSELLAQTNSDLKV